ncbi:MAG TPA: hypothetical protein VF126_13765 [Acidobacteriaceae bacterium]
MAANDLLDRYLYAVSRYLPASRQNDLLSELAANLHSEMEDKATALGRPLTEDEQADVLRRHGHPVMVAARYQPHRSLIGPEIFPFYWFTVTRVMPWVAAIWLLITAMTAIWGPQGTSIAERINIGHVITGLIGTLFQFLAWMTAGFAALEYFKGHWRNKLTHPDWDPRKLPKAEAPAHQGPRHPWADVIASVVFIAWLLAFPRFPVLLFGPYVSVHLLNIELPAIWHTFYWFIVGFNLIQLVFRIVVLSPPMRRYYQAFESTLHGLGIGILVFLLSARDYVGQATFGASPMSPETVATLNTNIHRGLLVVLIIAIIKFVWDTVQKLRLQKSAQIPART